jgi:hypothetical protein
MHVSEEATTIPGHTRLRSLQGIVEEFVVQLGIRPMPQNGSTNFESSADCFLIEGKADRRI